MDTIVVHNFSLGYRQSLDKSGIIFPAFNISASSSEMIALIGRNGIGKSTFLRTLVGLQKPLSGDLYIMGKHISAYSQRELASVISFVSTENIRVQNLKVFNLVALGRHPYTNWFGTLARGDKAKVIDALEMVNLQHLIWRNVAQLSDGEFQRAMIARTLAQDTPIIILDEPTAFLDLPNKYEIILLLRKLARQKNKTIIFSTHDLSIAMRLSDKIWLMAGDCLQQGAPEDLALKGAYGRLFENTLLSFDYNKGSVDLGIELTKEICLKTEFANYWIERALERMGFKVVTEEKANIPLLNIVKNDDGTFKAYIEYNERKEEFTDLYDLGRFLLKLIG